MQEATAKLEEKRAEEASGRAALADTYARIRDLESKISLGLSVKSDEVIKEQQLVLQLNIAKQDALAKSEVINSLMAATKEAEIRMATADAELHDLGKKLEDLKAQEISKSARIQAKTQQLEDEKLVIAELKKARENRDVELSKELEAARAEGLLPARGEGDHLRDRIIAPRRTLCAVLGRRACLPLPVQHLVRRVRMTLQQLCEVVHPGVPGGARMRSIDKVLESGTNGGRR